MWLQELFELLCHIFYLLFSVRSDMVYGLPFEKEEE